MDGDEDCEAKIRLRAEETFHAEDIVIVVGDHEAVERMAEEAMAKFLPSPTV